MKQNCKKKCKNKGVQNIRKQNAEISLTAEQKQVVVGTLLGDGWIELGKGAKNPRIGLQLSQNSAQTLAKWIDIMRNFITQSVYETVKQYDKGPEKPQLSIRTQRNAAFMPYLEAFKPEGEGKPKVVPAHDWLMQNVDTLGLAYLFMQDGSRHGLNAGSGFEIHSQGFNFEGTARLCLFLWDKFNIYAWPTRETKPKLGKEYWHVYISSDSFPRMVELIKPLVSEDIYKAKFHPLGSRQVNSAPNPKNKQALFYKTFSQSQLKNDVFYKESAVLIQRYAEAVSKNLKELPN